MKLWLKKYFWFSFSTYFSQANRRIRSSPNAKQNSWHLLNLNYVYQNGNNYYGSNNETSIIYGLTDKIELQSQTSTVFGKGAFGLGYQNVKVKYQFFKSKNNTLFVAGAISLKSPQWITSAKKLGFMSSGKRWKPGFHLIIDWLPHKKFAIFSQIVYTDKIDDREVSVYFMPQYSITEKWSLNLLYEGFFQFKNRQFSLENFALLPTYKITNKITFGAGIVYIHMLNDKKIMWQRLSSVLFLLINFWF